MIENEGDFCDFASSRLKSMSQRNIKCVERRVIFTGISRRKIFDADHEVFKILRVKVEKKKHSLFEWKTKGIFLSFTCLPSTRRKNNISPSRRNLITVVMTACTCADVIQPCSWMSNITEVHSKLRLHISVKPLFGVWPPWCATPSSSPSCVRDHEQYR